MDLSRTVSEINGNFGRKSDIIPTPVYFAPPLKGFPSELGIGAGGQKTTVMWLPGEERSLTISSAMWIQYTNVTDGQTDGRTDTERQQRPRLRIASRGKNVKRMSCTDCMGTIFTFDAFCYKHDICISRIVTQNTHGQFNSSAKFQNFSGEASGTAGSGTPSHAPSPRGLRPLVTPLDPFPEFLDPPL